MHEFIRFVLLNYERQLNIKVGIVSPKEMFYKGKRKGYQWLLCYFLDYFHAILKSRRFCRIPIRNIRLFDLHVYPSQSVVIWNMLFTMQYPLLWHRIDFAVLQEWRKLDCT